MMIISGSHPDSKNVCVSYNTSCLSAHTSALSSVVLLCSCNLVTPKFRCYTWDSTTRWSWQTDFFHEYAKRQSIACWQVINWILPSTFSLSNSFNKPKSKTENRKSSTYADFECLDSVVQQQYTAHNLCVLPVSLQFRRPDIVGSASRQAEARAHHAPTRVCNQPTHSRGEKKISARNKRSGGKQQDRKRNGASWQQFF